MKKFKFRLEKVLEYKKGIKEECEKDLMEANGILHESQEKLASLEEAARGNALQSEGNMPFGALHLSGLFGMRLVEEIEKTREFIVEAEEVVEEAMQKYIEASRELETFETLKKKKFEAFRENIRKEEEKFLDELVVQRIGRAKANPVE